MDVRQFNKPKLRGTKPQMGVTGSTSPEDSPDVSVTQEVSHSETEHAQRKDEVSADVISSYMEYLKENGIEESDVLQALDTLITEGNLNWAFKLFDRVDVTFRVRPAWVQELVMAQVEDKAPKMYARFADIVGTHNLAGSLVNYGDTRLDCQTEEDFARAASFVRNLPFIVQSKLIKELSLFDRLVSVATSDWAVENFTSPRSEG